MTATTIANFALAKLGTEQIASLDALGVKEATHAKLHYDTARDAVLRDHAWQFANRTVPLAFIAPASMATDLWAKTPETPIAWRKFVASEVAGVYTYTAATADFFRVVEVTLEDGTTAERWAWYASTDAVYPTAQARDAASHPAAVTSWLDCLTHDLVYITFQNLERGLWSFSYALPADCVRPAAIERADGSRVDRFARALVFGSQAITTQAAPDLWLTYTARVTDTNQFDPLFVDALATLLASRMARAITGSDSLESNLLGEYQALLGNARFRDAQETASGENRDTLAEILAGDLLGRRGGGYGAAGRGAVDMPTPGQIAVPDLDGEFEAYL